MKPRFYYSTNIQTGEVKIVDADYCNPVQAIPNTEWWTEPRPFNLEVLT